MAPPTRVGGGGEGRVRQPVVAGIFYPSDPADCAAVAASYLRQPAVAPGRWRGAIVPHAGWVCSGAIAGQAIAALAGPAGAAAGSEAGASESDTRRAAPDHAVDARSAGRPPDVAVVFGAIHTPLQTSTAVLSSHDAWHEPTGDAAVAVEAAARLAGAAGGLFAVDDRFHRREHAVEVELPLIQAAWPGARVLPIEVPVVDDAADIGRATARELAAAGLDAVFLASSDLTHYGPAYRFAPAGVGEAGLAWAKDNDRRLLDRVLAVDADGIVPEVREHLNACGGGAIAAMLAACREAGATSARLLRHASSFETLADSHPQPPIDAVGYAAVVVG